MAFCRLVFPLLVVSVISCYASNVPLYIWGDKINDPVRANPLETVTPDQLLNVLHKELAEDQRVVVFYEETLSVEDFSRKNSLGETSFPYLSSKVGDAIYLSSVENPVGVLNALSDESTTIKLTENGLSEEIPAADASTGKYVFVALNDAVEDESRTNLLQRHDAFMQETISKLQENGDDVLAVYTARYPSWIVTDAREIHSRVRRDLSFNGTVTSLDGILINVKSISLTSANETTPLTSFTSATSNYTDSVVTATFQFANQTSITLNFHAAGGYWFFGTVGLSIGSSVTESLLPVDEVFAILGFSYRCAQYVKFSTVNETIDYTITFENLKVQPYFGPTNTTTLFGDSVNCVGFFTAPIWAGLFITFLLLAITFYGIMMMMDIRTMDRFDDPKGKTITINASE